MKFSWMKSFLCWPGTAVLLIILLSAQAAAYYFLPVNQPEYQFIYDFSRREEIKTGFYYYNYNTAPYDFSRIDVYHPLHDMFGTFGNDKLRVFSFFSEDFRAARLSRGEGYESIRGGFAARPINGLFVYSNFHLDEKLAEDPDYTGKKWRGLAAEVENGFVAWRVKKLDFIFGRFSSFWGPSMQPLIFSSTAKPMDAFSIRLSWGRIYYTYQLARLSKLKLINEIDASSVLHNRYFAGHRLDFRLFDNLNLGFFETIIFSGVNRNLELNYLNPLLFYHADQLNENIDDNTFLGIDLSWYLYNRVKLFGQLIVDDYQVDNDEPGDREPDEIGYQIGLQVVDLFELLDIKAEYVRITNRTYNQINPANKYIHRDMLIGHEMGPDGDACSFSISRWFNQSNMVSLNFLYRRKGEGRIDDPWDTPWLEVEGEYDEPFPTGIVEKTFGAWLNISGFYNKPVFFSMRIGVDDIKDWNHIPGNDKTIPFFQIRISAIISALIDIE